MVALRTVQERYRAILETLRGVNADVIALQEVWGVDDRGFAAELANDLGYYSAFESRKSNEGVWFGNGVVSRWSIVATQTCPLPGVAGRDELRLVISAEIAEPRGNTRLYSTHLSWQAHDGAIRQQQVRTLANFTAQVGAADFVPIVCGDFNATGDSEEIRMLSSGIESTFGTTLFRDAWRDCGRGDGHTWDNVNPHAAGRFADIYLHRRTPCRWRRSSDSLRGCGR